MTMKMNSIGNRSCVKYDDEQKNSLLQLNWWIERSLVSMNRYREIFIFFSWSSRNSLGELSIIEKNDGIVSYHISLMSLDVFQLKPCNYDFAHAVTRCHWNIEEIVEDDCPLVLVHISSEEHCNVKLIGRRVHPPDPSLDGQWYLWDWNMWEE